MNLADLGFWDAIEDILGQFLAVVNVHVYVLFILLIIFVVIS